MNKMDNSRSQKEIIRQRFSRRAGQYDHYAQLQKRVAARLARQLPALEKPDILEIGCGTGLFTAHLIDTYDTGRFLITDLSQSMLDQCAINVSPGDHLDYQVMDGEQPVLAGRYDVIALAMTVQWFEQPEKSLARLAAYLKPGGHLIYSTIGPQLFPQWRAILDELDLPCGLVEISQLPGQVDEDTHQMCFDSGVHFLQSLKNTGASTPRAGYGALSTVELRRAIRLFEQNMNSCADWHILYGHLRG